MKRKMIIINKLALILLANNAYNLAINDAVQKLDDATDAAGDKYNADIAAAVQILLARLNPLQPNAFTLYGIDICREFTDFKDDLCNACTAFAAAYCTAETAYYVEIDRILADP